MPKAHEVPQQLFARQAMPMVWDFVENNPFAATRSWTRSPLDGSSARMVSRAFRQARAYSSTQLDATGIRPRDQSVVQSLTRRTTTTSATPISPTSSTSGIAAACQGIYPDLFSTLLVPKAQELIADPSRHGSRGRLRRSSRRASARRFVRMRGQRRRRLPDDGVLCLQAGGGADDDSVGASTGWETMLTGLLRCGLS